MKHTTFRDGFRNFARTLEDVARDIVRASSRVVREIAVMPWPAMLVCCIGLALVISILPLALFLFVAFTGIKLVVGAFVLDARRSRRERCGH